MSPKKFPSQSWGHSSIPEDRSLRNSTKNRNQIKALANQHVSGIVIYKRNWLEMCSHFVNELIEQLKMGKKVTMDTEIGRFLTKTFHYT